MMRVHHVGYLVKNLAKARDSFSVLGFCKVIEVLDSKGEKHL